jgi:hypothetical protein
MGEGAVKIMRYNSTWSARARAMHWRRLTIPLGLLLACTLLASLASTASATTYDMRGEWSMEFKSAGQPPLTETGIINQMNNGTGAFSGSLKASVGLTSALEGTVSGTTVSITSTTGTPFGVVTFTANSATLNTLANSFSGSGIYYVNGTETEPGEVTATRLRSYTEIEEQEARERQEQEEREARANVRGEWSLTLEEGQATVRGIALITQEANLKNEFAAGSAIFESVVPGTFSGTLEGSKATVTITTQAAGPFPAGEFTSNTIAVASTSNSMSMSGTGNLSLGGGPPSTATLTATRTKTYQEVKEREASEQEAIEKQEREAREAKEKAEREARERTEREVREKLEREAREAAERAAIAKSTSPGSASGGATPTLVSVGLLGKSFVVSSSASLSLRIENPNPYAISGRVTLITAPTGHAGKSSTAGGKGKTGGSLGTASFGISPGGAGSVKVKLSQGGRRELARHKSLRVLATIITHAAGQTTTTKTFSITLHAAKPTRAKH